MSKSNTSLFNVLNDVLLDINEVLEGNIKNIYKEELTKQIKKTPIEKIKKQIKELEDKENELNKMKNKLRDELEDASTKISTEEYKKLCVNNEDFLLLLVNSTSYRTVRILAVEAEAFKIIQNSLEAKNYLAFIKIKKLFRDDFLISTLTEQRNLIRHLKSLNWQTVGVDLPPQFTLADVSIGKGQVALLKAGS
jgi:hypothetical protein